MNFALCARRHEHVGVLVTTPGADMNIEDQRNYGDSSYKAFIPGSSRHSQRVDIAFDTSEIVVARDTPQPPIRIGAADSAILPRFDRIDGVTEADSYVDMNRNREELANAGQITVPFNPAGHLCDDDTLMENIPAIVSQAATLRASAPDATLRLAPVLFDRRFRDLSGTRAMAPGSRPRGWCGWRSSRRLRESPRHRWRLRMGRG